MLSVSRVDDFDLPGEADLKVYQRLWIRKIVGDRGGYRPRVLEIGPGTSVDLVDHLQFGEYWVLDAAPQWRRAGVRVIEGALGEVELPRDYFDVVCSVSVLEHLQHEAWPAAAEALRSCLRWGGLSAHCIDGKCRGRPGDHFEQMLLWKEFLLNTGLAWIDPPPSLSSPSVFWDRGV